MSEKINLKELQRQDSDKKIMTAAIKVFGENGFTHTSFAQIAKEAGVSKTLAAKRFNSKEELFATAYFRVIKRTYEWTEAYTAVPECLIAAIEATKRARENDPEGFRFMKLAITSSDLPAEFQEKKVEFYTNGNLHKAVKAAQAEGRLIQGNVFAMMIGLFVNVFFQVDLALSLGLPVPDNDYFLRGLIPTDQERERLLQQKAELLEGIGQTFEVFAIVNPETNEAQLLRSTDLLSDFPTKDVRKLAKRLIEKTVPEKEQAKVTAFTDFSDITERMGTRKFLLCDYRDIWDHHIINILIPLKRDSAGRITELAASISIIDE